jgi:sialate O-acetylesterase
VFNDKKVSLSPEVTSAEVKDGKVILTLDQPILSGILQEFEIADEKGKFVNAEATADGNRITILSPLTSLKVRYAWKDDPKACVRSQSGLPMSSFELKINN